MGRDGLEVLREAHIAWESNMAFEAYVNISSAVSQVDLLNRMGSSKVCTLSCFLRGAWSLRKVSER